MKEDFAFALPPRKPLSDSTDPAETAQNELFHLEKFESEITQNSHRFRGSGSNVDKTGCLSPRAPLRWNTQPYGGERREVKTKVPS